MSKHEWDQFDDEAQLLKEIQEKAWYTRYKTYAKLSGPGWLQSALTLGGGSLTSSLYLGVLAGFGMLWLQPLAMIMGIIMLSALGYVTLATNKRPFHAINEHINPVLGWGWALAAMLASIVWALPQFALANGVIQQNLMPGLLGPQSSLGDLGSKLVIAVFLLAITIGVTWSYGSGNKGVRFFEMLLKILVAIIVLSFMGVVVRLMAVADAIAWKDLFAGFIPNPALIFRPADGFAPILAGLSDISAEYWTKIIITRQQQVMAAAISSAVGINMTFLFAYSMLRRRWGTEYKGLMKFDLATGMLIPFMLATSCVITASASQFHTVPQPGFSGSGESQWEPGTRQVNEYNRLIEGRLLYEFPHFEELSSEDFARLAGNLGEEDLVMAATLITRDAFDLAFSLEPLLGRLFGNIIFGIGVLGMAISSVTLMMVICGFVVCEIMKVPYNGWQFRVGILIPGVGILGPFFWGQAYFWLAIPTSVITLLLLPIAYVAFFLMINNKKIMGEHMPTGRSRVTWNFLMVSVILLVGSASLYMLWQYAGIWGYGILGLFLASIAITEWVKKR